jgi:hypothetical protein
MDRRVERAVLVGDDEECSIWASNAGSRIPKIVCPGVKVNVLGRRRSCRGRRDGALLIRGREFTRVPTAHLDGGGTHR